MFTKGLRRLGLMALLMGQMAPIHADVISYDFSGTLSQPYDGASTFTGTFTYDTDLQLSPTIAPSANGIYYSGTPVNPTEPLVSMTFNLGNTPSSTFGGGGISEQEVFVSHQQGTPYPTASQDVFQIYEKVGTGSDAVYAELTLTNNNLVQPAPLTSDSPPSQLSLSDFSMGGTLALWGGGPDAGPRGLDELGTVTALGGGTTSASGGSESPVPEPASLVVFASLGAAFCAFVRRNRGRQESVS